MATGFMTRDLLRNCMVLALALACGAAHAADIALVGTIGRKAAVVALDGGDPKTVKLGQTWNGITVLEVEHDSAVIEVDGAKRTLQRGAHYRGAPPIMARNAVVLSADGRGHFFAEGAVNGLPVRFLVDTGASMVVLSAADALRLGIDYRRAPRTNVQTAGGPIVAYLVTLDRVKVGAIELVSIDGLVTEQPGSPPLLGMSFLNRVEMRRNGDSMTLIRRY
jgi:aspartyl protease family protein